MSERVNCFSAGCNCCTEGIYVGKTYFGEAKYHCCHLKGKHKKIRANCCSKFRCNKYSSNDILCKNCRKGE